MSDIPELSAEQRKDRDEWDAELRALQKEYWESRRKADERRERIVFVVWAIAMALGLGFPAISYIHAVRAEPAKYACEAKRMDYRRYSFSSTVICVPKALDTRSDTLTIQR